MSAIFNHLRRCLITQVKLHHPLRHSPISLEVCKAVRFIFCGKKLGQEDEEEGTRQIRKSYMGLEAVNTVLLILVYIFQFEGSKNECEICFIFALSIYIYNSMYK